jgi:hypothetical protein
VVAHAGGVVLEVAEGGVGLNPYMRRINDALGYAPTHTTFEYQLDL